MAAAPDLSFLDAIDPTSPDGATDGGRPFWNVRCRIPFTTPTPDWAGGFDVAESIERDAAAVDLEGDDERVFPDEIEVDPDATGDPGSDDEQPYDDIMLQGVSSSTSVDFYGTEMSLRALKMMAVQMMAAGGIPYLPRHNFGLMGAVEWDMIIGRTVHAEVVPVDEVVKAYNASESQFLLRSTVKLIPVPQVSPRDMSDSEKAAHELAKRTARGEVIGQSIGGWFTSLQVIQNEDGDVERMIVTGVELDHLAVTRAPANPDASGIIGLRDALRARLNPAPVDAVATAGECFDRVAELLPGDLATRHLVGVQQREDGTVAVILEFSGAEDDDEGRGEGDEDEYDMRQPEDGQTSTERETGTTIEPMCAKSEEDRGRIVLSWDADPTPEAVLETVRAALDGELGEHVRSVLEIALAGDVSPTDDDQQDESSAVAGSVTLDSAPGTGDDDHEQAAPDARGSAPPVQTTTSLAGDPTSEASTETDMPTIEELSALLDSKLAPLNERVAALEGGGDADSVQSTPTPDQRVEAAEARAAEAERAMIAMLKAPNRVGNAVRLAIPTGPAARTGYEGLVTRVREVAPECRATTLVAEDMIDLVSDDIPRDRSGNAIAPAVIRSKLERGLAGLINAAVADGLIIPPQQRAAGWGR